MHFFLFPLHDPHSCRPGAPLISSLSIHSSIPLSLYIYILSYRNLKSLTQLTSLERLSVLIPIEVDSEMHPDLLLLTQLTALRWNTPFGLPPPFARALTRLEELELLCLSGAAAVHSLATLAQLPKLQRLSLHMEVSFVEDVDIFAIAEEADEAMRRTAVVTLGLDSKSEYRGSRLFPLNISIPTLEVLEINMDLQGTLPFFLDVKVPPLTAFAGCVNLTYVAFLLAL